MKTTLNSHIKNGGIVHMAMTINKRKIAVVGCGLVGSSTAFSLITQGICDIVMMIDINKEKALGEALDLRDSIEYLNRNVQIRIGDYSDCGDADIVVITAGPPPKPGQTRLDTLAVSAKIIKSIVPPVMKSGFNGIFLVISNPCDIITQYVYKLSGLPKNQVIGTGTALDSSRLKNYIGELIHVDPRSIQAFTMGEHGDSQMVPWKSITVSGKSFADIMKDNPDMFKNINMDELVAKTAREGFEILNRKGTTYYGIASTAAGIIKAILHDENRIIPVSTLLEGEYGETGVFAGVPAVLNRHGAADILELHMTSAELEKFRKSVSVIRQNVEKIMEYDSELEKGA